jgi:hypothetical protein
MVHHMVTKSAYIGELRAYGRTTEKSIQVDQITGRRIKSTKYIRRPDEETMLLSADVCPPIIDKATWTVIQNILKHNQAAASRNMHKKESALLSRGHIFCGHCHRPAYTSYRRDGNAEKVAYRYRGNPSNLSGLPVDKPCPHGFCISVSVIDDIVWNSVVELLTVDLESHESLFEAAWRRKGQLDSTEPSVQSSIEATDKLIQQKQTE